MIPKTYQQIEALSTANSEIQYYHLYSRDFHNLVFSIFTNIHIENIIHAYTPNSMSTHFSYKQITVYNSGVGEDVPDDVLNNGCYGWEEYEN